MNKYITKDSGNRTKYKSGMNRDIQDDKPRYDLIDGEILERLALLMARGAKKYGERNWEKANSVEELEHFKASAFRHFMAWMYNKNTEEDHAVAIFFNVMCYEAILRKLK